MKMDEFPVKRLDPQLWHACAGGMVQMPPVNSKVFYYPQGHAEHAVSAVDFPDSPRIPPFILCHVSAVRFLADEETDEVYAKMKLIPLPLNEMDLEDDAVLTNTDSPEKPASFSKTLTQSDANNGGGFSVPRYCAETIFPRLDYSIEPPVQAVVARDVHGVKWEFRHIYRGTPRRHLLTTGWSAFVNKKKLVAGDSVVFLRSEKGDLCVGIRRAKRGLCPEPSSTLWSPGCGYGGKFSMLLREEEGKLARNGFCRNSGPAERGKVAPETVVEAAVRAARGQPFEVAFYPRANTPEFCVRAGSVKAAMRNQWCPGLRFKMPFETEDSSRISWFMGTVSSVQVADPIRWPNSPWRALQVTWDEPDLLQNVKRVSPWLVDLVSPVPIIHMSTPVPPFTPPRKRLRLPHHSDFPGLEGHFLLSPFSGSLLGPPSPPCFLSNIAPESIQGARQTFDSFLLDLNPIPNPNNNRELHNLGELFRFKPTFDPKPRIPEPVTPDNAQDNESLSCVLTIGNNSTQSQDKSDSTSGKKSRFLLFGQTILTEQQMSLGCTSSASSDEAKKQFSPRNSACGVGISLCRDLHQSTELRLDTGHCKVFLESEDVGRTLDLSALGSYEELYMRLVNMFGIERSNMVSRVLYQDGTGALRKAGDEPFSEFIRKAKRLTILMDSSSKIIERTTMLSRNGFDATTKAGPLSTYA